MALTNRVLLAYQNLADGATISATNQLTTLPVQNLQTVHIVDKFQGSSATNAITVTVNGTVGAVGLFGITTPTTRFKVQLANVADFSVTLYDSGFLSSQVDSTIGYFLHFLNTPTTATYCKISLDTAIIQAGRLFIGPYLQFDRNFDYGLEQGVLDLSRRTKSRGGQTYVDIGAVARLLRFTMPSIRRGTESDFIKALDLAIGLRSDMLVCLDPTNIQQGRDSIFGLMTDLSTMNWRSLRQNSKTYSIEERL